MNKFFKLSPIWGFIILAVALAFAFFFFSSNTLKRARTTKKQNSTATINLKVATIKLKVATIATNLQAPTAIAFPSNGEVWITEQGGKIKVIKNGKVSDVPILDLKSKLKKFFEGYDERGLLGITLHPQFKTNKKFYVFYSVNSTQKSDHTSVIAEYQYTDGLAPLDPNSGRVIFTIENPQSNHNGGCLQFGPDGYLYISVGDGGGQGDKHGTIGNGQDMDTWHGKILRVDVNTESTYLVPKDNPFIGKEGYKPEIWAYGFRNPWRFSFDKTTGQLFVGDVGQDKWEEVDIVKKGANYGWRIAEGTHCYNPATACDLKGITMPISEYPHTEGLSVTGGYVYNGKQLPGLKNKYVFADWTGPVFYLQKVGTKWSKGKITLQNFPKTARITSFGEDQDGELYVLTNPETGPENKEGIVYKIVKN